MLATGSIYLIADLLRPPGAPRDRSCERRTAARRCCAMMGLVALVVALVILVFVGLGYLFGRIFL